MERGTWNATVGFVIGIAATIFLPLLAEQLVGDTAPDRPVYLPQTFVETADALDRYRADHGRVPTAEEGLAALVPDYLPELPLDPWTHQPFVYKPSADGSFADVVSYGSDGKPGGEGPAADISLLALSMGPPPPTTSSLGIWFIDASFLLAPLVGFIGARRRRWAAGMLAGTTCFAGVLLVSIALARVSNSTGLAVATVTAVLSLAAGILVLRGTRGASVFALVTLLLAWIQLTLLAGY